MADRNRPATTSNLGFLLAKAAQRWNEVLEAQFRERGYTDIRASFGSILLPLFEADGLSLGEIAKRGGLSKQTVTTLVRVVERAALVDLRRDDRDRRVTRVWLTRRGREVQRAADAALERMDDAVVNVLPARQLQALEPALRTLKKLTIDDIRIEEPNAT